MSLEANVITREKPGALLFLADAVQDIVPVNVARGKLAQEARRRGRHPRARARRGNSVWCSEKSQRRVACRQPALPTARACAASRGPRRRHGPGLNVAWTHVSSRGPADLRRGGRRR